MTKILLTWYIFQSSDKTHSCQQLSVTKLSIPEYPTEHPTANPTEHPTEHLTEHVLCFYFFDQCIALERNNPGMEYVRPRF